MYYVVIRNLPKLKKSKHLMLLLPVRNYRRVVDDLLALIADSGDEGREISDPAACLMSHS